MTQESPLYRVVIPPPFYREQTGQARWPLAVVFRSSIPGQGFLRGPAKQLADRHLLSRSEKVDFLTFFLGSQNVLDDDKKWFLEDFMKI